MKWIRQHFEAWLVVLAAKIIKGRNFERSAVVSRRDNNDMRYMGEKLESISQRMRAGYKDL